MQWARRLTHRSPAERPRKGVDEMRHVTDSSGTRWEVAFTIGSAGGARGDGNAFPEVMPDTIVFTAADGRKVDRTKIAGMWGGVTNAELVRLLEETPEDQGS